MNQKDMRTAITQADFNKRHSGLIFIETIVLAGYIGVRYQSWWVFCGLFVCLIVFLRLPAVRFALNFLFSALWAYAVFSLFNHYSGVSLAAVASLIAFLVSAGMHSAGNQWLADIARRDSR